jgi:hypothetical protein
MRMIEALCAAAAVSLLASAATAQTSNSGSTYSPSYSSGGASGGQAAPTDDAHYYSHYQPYFPPAGVSTFKPSYQIPDESTYHPYFPPAYAQPTQGAATYSFGNRIVESGTHNDLLAKQGNNPAVDALTGRAKYSYDPPPSSYQGDTYYGYDSGCRVQYNWDPIYHRYVKQSGCQ